MDLPSFQILSLCVGAGGLDLGLKLAERTARVVGYVEIEAYCCEILATQMEAGYLDEAPVWTDLRTFSGRPWRGKVDCITAGYPCQPFSVAGRQRAEKDPRHLWPEVRRIVEEVQPRCCFFENVPGHLRLGFEQVHDDLYRLGYRVKAGLFSAEEVGAPHKRERLFILAYREGIFGQRPIPEGNCGGKPEETTGSECCDMANPTSAENQWRESGDMAETQGGRKSLNTSISNGCPNVGNPKYAGSPAVTQPTSPAKDDGARWCACGAQPPQQLARTGDLGHPHGTGLEGWRDCGQQCADELPAWPPSPTQYAEWDSIPADLKPAVCRMADGLAYRVDRLRTAGNGVVPLVAAYAWRVLTTRTTIGDS